MPIPRWRATPLDAFPDPRPVGMTTGAQQERVIGVAA
eukprot:COSAG01_NODE_74908_length_199_cov_165.990000_1_plen_36_part_01